MESQVHVVLWKSSVFLSMPKILHLNQPSSSWVSRSTSREAFWVRDTRPEQGEEGEGEEIRGREMEREKQKHMFSVTEANAKDQTRLDHRPDELTLITKSLRQNNILYVTQ